MISNPMHPGEFLKLTYMEPDAITVTELASKLNVSKASVSRLITGKSNMSTDMAIKLESIFKRKAKSWLLMQVNYDLSQQRGYNSHE